MVIEYPDIQGCSLQFRRHRTCSCWNAFCVSTLVFCRN